MGKKKKLLDKTPAKYQKEEKNLIKRGKEIPEKHRNSNTEKQEPCEGYTSRQIWIAFCGYGLLLLGVYVYTMYPTITGGDSGELMAAAQELGVAHPPGYPLFTVLSWLAIKVIPVEDVAWKCNLLNALFSALAGLVFAVTIYRYTGSLGCAIGGSSAWCFCKLTWTWSASAEVFGLNNLFTTVLMYLMAVFQDTHVEDKPKMACLGAFACGLSLTNQHTIVLYVGIIALWVLLELYNEKLLNSQLLIRVGLWFSCGLLPYLYLPLSAYLSNGRWTWGDQRTVQGFLTHFFRREYGTFDLAKGSIQDGATILSKLSSYGWHTLSEYSIASLVFFFLGLKETFNRAKDQKKRSLAVLFIMMTVYLTFFSWRANLNIANPLLLGVVERFWMQADCVFVLLAAVGASYLERLFRLKLSDGETTKVLFGVGLAVCACQLQQNFTECNQRNSRVVEEFGLQILENVPPNTLIFTKGDLPSNLFRYLYLSRNHRPDVTVFDQEVMTLPWSLPMMAQAYPKIVFPGDRMGLITGYIKGTKIKLFNAKTFLDENIDRFPIIACIGMQDYDSSWKEGYELFPFGPCSWIYKKGTDLDINTLIKMALNISHNWDYPYNGFDETSWDRVATDEMWNAKTNIGLHLYVKAVATDEDPEETRNLYLIKAFQIYKNAFGVIDPEDIPVYWRKNYGLVCERMLQIDHKYSYADIAKDAVLHFQKYLEYTPDDKDAPAINMVIHNLKIKITEHEKEGE